MLSSAHYVSPKPAALPPAAQPAMPTSGAPTGPSFAQFLSDQPDLLPPPPAHAEPVPVAPDSANEATAAPAPAANTSPVRRKEGNAAPAKPAAPAAGRAPEAAAASAKPADDAKACDADSETTDGTTDIAQAPETSGLNEFTQLIGLTVPTPQAVPVQAVATGLTVASNAEAAADATPAVTGAGTAHAARPGRVVDEDANDSAPRSSNTESAPASTTERRPAEAPVRASDAPRVKGIELAADKAAAARSASSDALQATTSAPGDASPRAAAAPDAIAPSFAAVLAQALPSATATADAAPVTATSQVHAALQSNAFGPELAASVSLLAVDGVQSAELQLNPAEMGPVAVQIVIDGSQAQVSFHAAQAETRLALEQSLPDLAAALQGQGLTLSGGGVFQQSSRDGKGGDAEAGNTDSRSSRADNTRGGRVGSASAAAANVRRAVGLLDTFA